MDTIFLMRQMKKYSAKGNPLFLAFLDLVKAFDWVPYPVIWWSLRNLGVDEWGVRVV